MASVKLDRIRKVYESGFTAIHDASFEVRDGEFMVLVGPSGCGKSTTLRMIAGLESISEGALYIEDQLVNDTPPKDRDVGMVFQNYALYPHMTVYENLAFGLKLRKYPALEIDQRVRHTAGLLGISDILERKPRQLSGGQQQRVAVGRAIVRKPKVFLFDEPLSNLDAQLRVQTRADVLKLHRQLGVAMLYVTHDQTEAMTMGDRIAVMKEGRIQQIDTPLNLYHHPANRFVAGFIGSPAMNFVKGRLIVKDGLHFQSLQTSLMMALSTNMKALETYAGKEIILGIRPEHISLDGNTGTDSSMTIREMNLEMVEPVGNEMFVHTSHGDDLLVARVPPQPIPASGEPIRLALDVTKMHFFDPQSEVAIH